MYYDVANKKYLYSLDSAKSWNSFNDETGKTPATLGTHQVLYSNSDSIWKYNADHRKSYNGRIYHIIKETNDLPTSYNDAREKKPSFKSIGIKKDKKDSTDKSKKGIRGFFNRLFGKHKKK